MSLTDWVDSGWAVPHSAGKDEIQALLLIVERDLQQCRTADLNPDWQLNIAYNAALQAATAALAATGYRISQEAHHYRTIESLRYTVGLDGALIRRLNTFRQKRNISDYDRAGMVTEHEAAEMISLAEHLSETVVSWLKEQHSNLV